MADASQKIILEGIEYDLGQLSQAGLRNVLLFKFVIARVQELSKEVTLLENCRLSMGESLKQEMISKKAGFIADDD